MNRIDSLPDLNWTERARQQIEMTGAELVEQSTLAFRFRNVMAAGLLYESLTGPPWLWFLMAEGTTFRDLIDMRRMQEMIPKGALTAVEVDDSTAVRFAEFYGLRKTDKEILHQGRNYYIMEKC